MSCCRDIRAGRAPTRAAKRCCYGVFAAVCCASLLVPGALFAVCGGSDLRPTLAPELLAEAVARTEQLPFHEGLAFEATRGDTRITLFGTIHLSDPALIIPDEIAHRILRADLLLVEVITEENSLLEEIGADPSLLFDAEGPGLRARLTEAEWLALSEQFSAVGMSLEIADRLRPWFVALLIELPPCEQLAWREGALSLDERVEALATATGTAVAGLDDVAQVLAFLTGASEDTQLDVLKMSLAGGVAGEDMIATAIATWQEQQPMLLRSIGYLRSAARVEDVDAWQDLYQRVDDYLVVKRNRSWLAAILERAQHTPEMVVAVGAAHLPGVHGLVNLLQAEDFRISRLNIF